MIFYFDFANYFKMIRLAWNEKAPKARYYYLAVLCVAVPVVSSFHAVCFFLDAILFPGLRKVAVREPVFMVGHARSGTTLTHRLMSKDAGRFSSFLLYECYFPSLLQKKLIRLGIGCDRRFLGGFFAKRVSAWEERRYGAHRHMHEMGLTIPEEDDIVLFYSLASGFWITKMPYMGDLDFYHMNDWSEAKRRRTNDFYRECVRRQLYLNGPDKIHLAKNPLWAGRVASLIAAFPDARFVVNVRDPRDTIPSLLKLVRAGWKQLGWEEARQQRCLQHPRRPVVALLPAPARDPRGESRNAGRWWTTAISPPTRRRRSSASTRTWDCRCRTTSASSSPARASANASTRPATATASRSSASKATRSASSSRTSSSGSSGIADDAAEATPFAPGEA